MSASLCPLSAALFLLFGLVFGSFGNVLILRLPVGKPITGRSQCPRCRKVLSWRELIPVLSYLVLRGRCRHCHKPISLLYPVMELASGGIFLFVYAFYGSTLLAGLLAFSLWLLLLLAVIDARTQGIPDALSLPFILLACLYALVAGSFTLSAPILFVAFFGLQWLLSRGRWVGSGDILLGMGIGFLLGDVSHALLSLGLTYVIGAIVASILLLRGKATRKSHIPFGPFLAVATVITMAWGDQLLRILIPGALL